MLHHLGLDPAAARKVLSHAYCAIIPIHPLPPPALPLSPSVPGPTYYGPTSESASPWLQLALYSSARCGPLSVVFVAGQRVWRLPAQLDGCTHALLWSWDVDPRAGANAQPQLIEGERTHDAQHAQAGRLCIISVAVSCGNANGRLHHQLQHCGSHSALHYA